LFDRFSKAQDELLRQSYALPTAPRLPSGMCTYCVLRLPSNTSLIPFTGIGSFVMNTIIPEHAVAGVSFSGPRKTMNWSSNLVSCQPPAYSSLEELGWMAYLISNMHSFCLPDEDSRNDMSCSRCSADACFPSTA